MFIAGVGTGGTVTGTSGTCSKSASPNITIITVEPDTSTLLSGGAPGPHKLQGFAPGFMPEHPRHARLLAKSSRHRSKTRSRPRAGLAREEGILARHFGGLERVGRDCKSRRGRSSPEKRSSTIGCDTGERYLSSPLYSEIENPVVEAALV